MAEKTQKPTEHKLREARKRGEVAKSRELTSLASYVATVILFWTAAEPFGKRMLSVVEHAVLAPGLRFDARDETWLIEMQQMLSDAAWIVLPVLLVSVLVAALSGAMQVRGIFSFEPITLKFERIDPAKGLKNLLSTRQLFELAKTLIKTALLTAVMAWVIAKSLSFMLEMVYTPAVELLHAGGSVALRLMRWAAVIYTISAAMDYGHQRYEFMKQQRMSVDEVRRETRDEEGDPLVRAQRRSRARDFVYGEWEREPPPEDKGQSGS
jgi:type III secretion protein U